MTPPPLIGAILPAAAKAWELRDGRAPLAALFAEEEAIAAPFAPARRNDFARGRFCARAALKQWGHPGTALGRRPNSAPDWPPQFVGSITHTQGYAAAVTARSCDYIGLGLDAERADRVTPELWSLLFTSTEQGKLAAIPMADQPLCATIMFSAKEAYFKAVSPLAGVWIDFLDVEVAVSINGWTAEPLVGPLARRLPRLDGAYLAQGGLVLTCAWIVNESSRARTPSTLAPSTPTSSDPGPDL